MLLSVKRVELIVSTFSVTKLNGILLYKHFGVKIVTFLFNFLLKKFVVIVFHSFPMVN